MTTDNDRETFNKQSFWSTKPFKILVSFAIPLFEGYITTNALEKWLNLLEGYY
jgi:hypothetical protein